VGQCDRYPLSAIGFPLTAGLFPPSTCHPERQRRILVHGVSETKACKYRSAGRLPPPAVYFPPPTGHPERQRRISVHAVSDTKACKYRSAGRLSASRCGLSAFRRAPSFWTQWRILMSTA